MNTGIDLGGDARGGGIVPAGRYIAKIDRAVPGVNKHRNHELRLGLTVKDAAGTKTPLSFWIVYQRGDGSRVLAGCRRIQALTEACQLPDVIRFDTKDLVGKVVEVTLSYEDDGEHQPRNTLEDARVCTLDPSGRPYIEGDTAVAPAVPFPASTAGLPPGYDAEAARESDGSEPVDEHGNPAPVYGEVAF